MTQNPCTTEDLKATEQRAIRKYLSKFDVIDKLPPLNDIEASSVAPYYKLNPEGTVLMQVVRMGNKSAATEGETIYFRYLRYNLLSYLENGVLPSGQGNGNSTVQAPANFKLGAVTPWGTAIQLPLLLGLPIDTEVNLIVASEAGPQAEATNYIPYLYNIRYSLTE